MILQTLNEYYERKFAHQAGTTDAGASIAPEGFESKEIPFVFVLDNSGKLVQIEDTRSGDGKKKQARIFLVPQGAKKSMNVAANLLWGNAEYALGIPDPKKLEDNLRKGTEAKYRRRLREMHRVFIDLIRTRLAGVANDVGVAAVLAFLGDIAQEPLSEEPAWSEITEKNPNLTFRLAGDAADMPVCARPAVADALQEADAAPGSECAATGFCLVRGEPDLIERLHPAIKGVWDAQTSGANIVSFNLDAFNSYAKGQGNNAPIGERAAFTYTTALNHLLRKGSLQRLQVGDASTVYWGESNFEDEFAAMFGGGNKDDPDRGTETIRRLLEATKTGVYLKDHGNARFCVLGLAPNAARIAVRFWKIGPVKEFAQNIARHFMDIAIDAPSYESGYLPLWKLLNSTALQNKSENVPPDLAGDTMRAILSGLPYPAMLLQAAVRRCRAEQDVNYPRAAVVKASLNRLVRHEQFKAKELDMSLDKDNIDPGYRLGRLFATFERLQLDAHRSDSGVPLNRTIRESYYGSASSSPSSAFPVLVKLHQHHLSKLEKIDHRGAAVRYRKLLGEIFEDLPAMKFPSHLSLPEQGLFAIGYYHQQQDFFKGKPKGEADSTPSNGNTEQ